MNAEIAEHGRMSESGSSLLRLIQNESTPLLDLFIRESIQNSLDAAKSDSENVNVDFVTGEFNSAELNKNFELITRALDERFPDGNYRFMSIKDSNTVGLTGPIHSDHVKGTDLFGNLLKLVYEICKPQQKDGAGGSWGLGKTIYFRLGIGLVIYYSRIYQDNRYQSRLAACFVEDERKADSIIPAKGTLKRGIAWWGKEIDDNKTVPIDDENEIEQVLSVFGLIPYYGCDTGTTVIIPYIDEGKLLSDCYIAETSKHAVKPSWISSIEDYLTVGVQRWYAPRLLNKYYKGPYLSVKINGVKLTVSKMLPLFRIIREFYIKYVSDKIDDDFYVKEKDIAVKIENIDLRAAFSKGAQAGKLIFAKITKSQFLMLAPENYPSPYQQIFNSDLGEDHSGNMPLITYTRNPGMIVGYDYKGPWTRDLPKSTQDEYIIGLFVLNSANTLKGCFRDNGSKELTLEEYIRTGEKADHAEWGDQSINGRKYGIVDKIQRGVLRKIANTFFVKPDIPYERRSIGLGHALAGILLPPTDFGKKANIPNTGGRNNGGNKFTQHSKSSWFKIIGGPNYVADGSLIKFELFMKAKEVKLQLQVIAGRENYIADVWEDEEKGTGKCFPLKFFEFKLNGIKQNVRDIDYRECSLIVGADKRKACDYGIDVEILSSSIYHIDSMVRLATQEVGTFVKGELIFSTTDTELMGNLKLIEG